MLEVLISFMLFVFSCAIYTLVCMLSSNFGLPLQDCIFILVCMITYTGHSVLLA